MFKLILISGDDKKKGIIMDKLLLHNYLCEHIKPTASIEEELLNRAPDLVILSVEDDLKTASAIIRNVRGFTKERPIPILGIIPKDLVGKGFDLPYLMDDFVVEPLNPSELALRVEKALRTAYAVENKDLIHNGALTIDLARREVTVDGNPISLTFKEYELLVFLAANKGRTFSRETLLNKIWGYDYYGGDRTVDVHIRRLRSKIEWGHHTFIETVRGFGYRFRK